MLNSLNATRFWNRLFYLGILLIAGLVLSTDSNTAAQDEVANAPPASPTAPEGPAQDANTLKFNFDDQPWPDVLAWFARQAGLSLVINDFPPGGFTFRDSRGYSPTEAIDLLNSVLLTKEFTLVRKDSLLILINTKNGIPYDLVPRKSIQELPTCGRFELVTVAFPLQGRLAEIVQAEVKPLIGPLGKLEPLPATGQVLVTETAGRMAAIDALIQAIPLPKPPKEPQPKPEPPPQFLKTYTITDLGLQSTATFLPAAVGGVRVTVDEPTNQLFIYATEKQHADIDAVLAKLRESARPADLVVQTYRYRSAQPTVLVEQLKALVPGVLFQVDSVGTRLIAIGNAKQQETLQQALESIEGPAETNLSLKQYPMARAAQTQAMETIQKIVPGVSVTAHSTRPQLLIIATEAQHQQIATVIEQLSEAGVDVGQGDQQLATFTLVHADPTSTSQTLTTLLPEIKFTVDTDNRRLLAVLSTDQQQRVQQWLSVIDVAIAPEREVKIEVYSVAPAVQQRLTTLFTSVLPEVKSIYDSTSKQLLVTALPADHKKLAALLETVQATMPEPIELKTYPLAKTAHSTAMAALQQLVPEVKVSADPESEQLIVYATAEDHVRFAAALKQLSEAGLVRPADDQLLQVYPIGLDQRERLDAIKTSLPAEFQGIQFLPSTDLTRLMVWGTPTQHLKLVELLDSLQTAPGEQSDRVLAIYPVEQGDPKLMQEVLARLFPTADVDVDADSGRVIVWATNAQHAQIKQAAQQLASAAQGGWENLLKTYVVRDVDLALVLKTVTPLLPQLTLSMDSVSNQLIAYGREKDHEKLQELLNQLQTGNKSGSREIKVYEAGDQDPVLLSTILSGLVPQTKISTQRGAKGLAIWATVEEHALIQSTLEQMRSLDNEKRQLKILSTKHSGAATAVVFLRGAAPNGVFFPAGDNQSIFAFATEEDLARVSQIMSELERQNSQPSQDVLRTYRYPASVIQAAKPLLTTRVPKAQPMTTVVDDQWMIWATESDHQTIESMLKSLSENLPQDTSFRLQLYNLDRVTVVDAQAAITSVVGTVTYLPGSEPRQLRVWTDGVKHSRVQELLEQLETQLVSTTEPRPLKVLPIDARTTVALVFQNLDAELIAKASIVQNVERNALLIRATDDVQQQIEQAVAQFLTALPDAPQRTAQSYQLNHLTPTAAVTLLTTLVPAATYAVDTVNNKVAATALAEQHQAIADALQQIDVATEIQVETRAYRVPTGYGAALGTSLAPMYPQAKVTWDVSGSALIIVARAAEHAELDRVLREILEGSQDESTTEIYALATASPVNALAMIKQVYPRSQGTVDLATNSAVITASPREHEGIKELMTKLESAGQGRQVIAYPIRKSLPTVAQTALLQAFPRATVSLDTVRDLLVVTTSLAEHEQVKQWIETFEQGPEKPLLIAKSYAMNHLTAAATMTLLKTLVPAANYAVDAENNKLAVTGTAEQQSQIAATLQEIDVPRAVDMLPRAYRVPPGFGAALGATLAPLYPRAKITSDAYTGSTLFVVASESEHAELDLLIRDVLEGKESESISHVYRLGSATPATVVTIVKQIFPRCQATADATSGTLVVTASAADHEKIAALVKDLDGSGTNFAVQAYELKRTSLTATQAAIAKVFPRAVLTPDAQRGGLIVAASLEEQQQIRGIVEQLEAGSSTNLLTKAYRLQAGNPRSAENALEVLLPAATFSADVSASVLWATTDVEGHAVIRNVIDQLEAADQDSARVQTFQVAGGNSEDLYTLLQRMYRNDDSVRLSFQRRSNAILFVGPAKQELAVKQIVDQWSAMGGEQAGREIKVYDLAELDGDVLVESLELLMERQVPAVDLQVQYTTNRLLAVATAEQHEQIVAAMKELQGAARRLEVFTLQVNTPETIEDAIRQLFLDLPFSASPSVNSSRENQQLFIRASESQLQQIRELLLKLGEPLAESSAIPGRPSIGIRGTGNMRILTSPAAPRLLQQIEELWPQISPNPLRIVSPSEGDKSRSPGSLRNENRSELPLDSPDEQPLPTPTPLANETTVTRVPTSLEPLQDRPPVLIFPSANELTVASADQEALAIIEQLFRILNEQQESAGKVEISGNFTIFQMENAGAAEMAKTVGQLFQQVTAGQSRGRSSSNSQNRVSIVADERLNSLIVYGSPVDRRTIESLIRVLDVSDAARSMVRVNEPRIVKVDNVLADKIMGVLESIYRTQLRPDQPPRVQIPAGVSVEVAMALREVNAAAAAPLLTLEVDQATNSIIVLASERLSMEVEALIHRLDREHKEGNTQGFKVIALEKGNTQRIEETLRRLIRDYSRRRP
ncbi:MAG: secretin N-terminal domain-containing protein [Pirellulaceae bacterium]|nr:secretin N-terminal domain-containing protein [Pirellulaceae bacterium]